MYLEKFTHLIYNRNIEGFDYFPTTIKIDKYQYYFSTRPQFAKTGKAFNRHFSNEFLFEIDIEAANKINKLYGVPQINRERVINFSIFSYLPLYDLILCFFLFRLFRIVFSF